MVALSNKLRLKRQREHEERAFQAMSGVSRLPTVVWVPSTAHGGTRLGVETGLRAEVQPGQTLTVAVRAQRAC